MCLIITALNLWVLQAQSNLIRKMGLREIGCENGRWMELAQDGVNGGL
jgi:hypothetical protein